MTIQTITDRAVRRLQAVAVSNDDRWPGFVNELLEAMDSALPEILKRGPVHVDDAVDRIVLALVVDVWSLDYVFGGDYSDVRNDVSVALNAMYPNEIIR